jgi:gliding motility-associated-like protein
LLKQRYILFFLLLVAGLAQGQQHFIENRGQWPEDFDFKYIFSNGAVFLNENSLTVNLAHPEDLATPHGASPVITTDTTLTYIRQHAYKVLFVGADFNCDKSGADKKETYHNYILGNDPAKWQSKVPLYGEVTYHNIYPNIDLRYYFSKEGNLKYDFVVHPGGEVSQIKLRYEGADGLDLVYGNLMVRNTVEDVLESAPYAFQNLEKGKTKVECSYRLNGNDVSYKLGRYKKNETLIIDPMLVFSSFTGSSSDNFGFTATPSADGGLVAGGIVYLNAGTYPVTSGAYQVANRGGHVDMGISKFSEDGSRLIYSTYIGGGGDEIPYSLFEREDRTLVILGSTGSSNYPVSNNAYQKTLNTGVAGPNYFAQSNLVTFPNGVDVVVTILDSTGGKMLGSTYFGGSWVDGFNIDLDHNYGDRFRGEIIADTSGNVFFVSSTFSNNLPATSNAFLQSWGARQDGFAASLNSDLSGLRWCTYIGGQQNDNALSVKLGKQNNVYIAGGTESPNLPFNGDSYRVVGIDSTDGYILNLSEADGSFISGTYNGTTNRDMNFFVEVDDSGAVYVMGQTQGVYPVDTAEYYNNPNSSQYIHQFTSDLKFSKRAMVFGDSTHGKSNISPTAFMVDECRNVFVSGWGGGSNAVKNQGTTNNMPVTINALQSNTDGSDFYFFVLDATWKKVNYATYFGGANQDHVDGGTSRFAKDGTIYQAVCAGCGGKSNFPTTNGVVSRVNASVNCNLAALKINFDALDVIAEVVSDKDSSCIPYTANLTNLSFNADKYIWLLPNSQTVNSDIPAITISDKGAHKYKLIAIDTTCGFRDTVDLVLYGFKDTVNASFSLDYDSCSNNFQVQTINTSLDADYYLWDFGDGKTSNLKNPMHGYVKEGTYTIKLFTKNSYCDLVDSTSVTVKFKKRYYSADFSITNEPCRDGAKVSFAASGTGFQEYLWQYGDGSTGEGPTVVHDFSTSGSYKVKLILRDTLCHRYLEKDTVLDVYTSGYEPLLPNVFTPNGDGLNEVFGLPQNLPANYFSAFSMRVYNRWGSLLYETNNVNEPWDGSFEGSIMAEGVYFYIINTTDGCNNQNEYNGFVHLLNVK